MERGHDGCLFQSGLRGHTLGFCASCERNRHLTAIQVRCFRACGWLYSAPRDRFTMAGLSFGNAPG